MSPGGVWGEAPCRGLGGKAPKISLRNVVSEQAAQQPTIETGLIRKSIHIAIL